MWYVDWVCVSESGARTCLIRFEENGLFGALEIMHDNERMAHLSNISGCQLAHEPKPLVFVVAACRATNSHSIPLVPSHFFYSVRRLISTALQRMSGAATTQLRFAFNSISSLLRIFLFSQRTHHRHHSRVPIYFFSPVFAFAFRTMWGSRFACMPKIVCTFVFYAFHAVLATASRHTSVCTASHHKVNELWNWVYTPGCRCHTFAGT